ncbi:hypothetical protein GDO78_012230 [Eleutherodactylus coqui]|uniref:Uncharacterized protein n=1 Tax=Eleutherodactylus coqui TaxID=57060 RepID=A0A8J6F2A2_ELECQ|nr:hypothetical protein GDO78_012230 [Eleutherodactylus coqui]
MVADIWNIKYLKWRVHTKKTYCSKETNIVYESERSGMVYYAVLLKQRLDSLLANFVRLMEVDFHYWSSKAFLEQLVQ